MINNYPPLSFYIVGALGSITGDPIVAGRLVSLAAFFAVAGGIIVILREMGADVLAALFGGLFFAAGLLVASDYVAMDDPQLLGHALQLAGLSLLLQARREVIRRRPADGGGPVRQAQSDGAAAGGRSVAVAGRTGARLALCRRLAWSSVSPGWCWSRLLLGVDLFTALASPRRWALANFATGRRSSSAGRHRPLIAAAALAWRRAAGPRGTVGGALCRHRLCCWAGCSPSATAWTPIFSSTRPSRSASAPAWR